METVDMGTMGSESNELIDNLTALKDTMSLELEFEKERQAEVSRGIKKEAQERLEALKAYKRQYGKTAKEEYDQKLKDYNKFCAEQAKNGKKIAKKEQEEFKKQLQAEFDLKLKKEQEFLDKRAALRKKADAAEKARQEREAGTKRLNDVFASGVSLAERASALSKVSFSDAFNALADFTSQLNGKIESIAGMKGTIDTRLQGSNNKTRHGSYWDAISADITGNVAMSPLVKQSAVAENVKNLVNSGISFNVEQRALIATIKDKIATTFNAQDGTLTKLVRIQAADSTAARLGMESALTSFLNRMYETTEYMQGIATNIRTNLYEAEALMTATNATAFEYQVQKWMGSLYSLGMSDTSVGGISKVLGSLASGDISGLTGSGTGNLLLMAANKAGISLSDALANGLDDSETNTLMTSMVQYLHGIYNQTGGNNLLLQQYANVFGLKASDIKAAANMSVNQYNGTVTSNLSYSGALSQLNKMANSMYLRSSAGELMGNIKENFTYGLAAGIANNAPLYALYNVANMLDSVAGGIDIPAFSVMGTGVNLNTTVANLMKVGALSGSVLSGIGSMVSAFGNGGNGGITGGGLLRAFGIDTSGSKITVLDDGSGSAKGLIGNSDSGDVVSKTKGDANDDANGTLASAVDDSEETKLSTVDQHIVNIYNLLLGVTTGSTRFYVTSYSGVSGVPEPSTVPTGY